MAKIGVGDTAPDFSLPDQRGETVTLSAHRGSWVVIFFYPADNTAGCTAEACSFRNSYDDFGEVGAVVIGVSGDSVESHDGFATKHNLPYTLVSDESGELRDSWGVPKSFGLLPGRVTYVIDPDGVVRNVYSSQLLTSRHPSEALKAIRRHLADA